MAVSIIGPKFYAWDSDTGKPLAFGKVYTYQAGTNTPKATFTTEGGETQNANPVILNGAGYADIYLNGSYKIVVKDADDVEVWTSDPVSDPSQLQQEWVRQRNITQVNTTTFTVDGELTDEYVEGVAVRVKQDSGFVTGTVARATYADGKTTVTLDFIGTETITASAVYAERALVSFQSLPKNLGDRTIYVGSVAELVAGLFSTGNNVKTLGYYTPGDGGGNDYEIVAGGTGVADGGSFIDLDNGLQARGLFLSSQRVPEQYGAIKYSSASPLDSSDAVEAWLKSGGGVGDKTHYYYCTRRLVVQNKDLDAFVNLVFDNEADTGGLRVFQENAQKTRIRGEIRSIKNANGIGLEIEYTWNPLIFKKQERLVDLDVLVANDPDGTHRDKQGYFVKGIVLKNVQEPVFNDTKIFGVENSSIIAVTDPDRWWQPGTIGLELQTDATATSAPQPTLYDFNNLHVGRMETAVQVSSNFEGLIFTGGEFVACMDGLKIQPNILYSGGDRISHVALLGTHANCARSNITGKNVFSLILDACKFNRFEVLEGQDFRCFDLENIDRLEVTGGDANGMNTVSGGGLISLGRFVNVNRATFLGFHGFRLDTGIDITDSLTRNVYVDDSSYALSDDVDTGIPFLTYSGTGSAVYQINQPLIEFNSSAVALAGGTYTQVVASQTIAGVSKGAVYEVRASVWVDGDDTITPDTYDLLEAQISAAGAASPPNGQFNDGAEVNNIKVNSFGMPKAGRWMTQLTGRYEVTSGLNQILEFRLSVRPGSNSNYPANVQSGYASIYVRRVR